MKNILLSLLFLALAVPAFSAHHEQGDSLKLEKRQADAVMTITNVDIGDEMSTISATGKMGEYGTVYVTYHLTYATRTSGFVSGNGRGAIDANNVAAGAFRGVWTREGSTIKIVGVKNGYHAECWAVTGKLLTTGVKNFSNTSDGWTRAETPFFHF